MVTGAGLPIGFWMFNRYGVRAVAGGGRSSARETIGRVAAGAVAKKVLATHSGMEVLCYVVKVQEIEAKNVNHETVSICS